MFLERGSCKVAVFTAIRLSLHLKYTNEADLLDMVISIFCEIKLGRGSGPYRGHRSNSTLAAIGHHFAHSFNTLKV